MSEETIATAGVLLLTVPTIVFGGASLLTFIRRDVPGYLDNPVRRRLFRAGHAHAGVLVLFALVALPYVDAAGLGAVADTVARVTLVAAPILLPAGFFLSVTRPDATEPNRLIGLVYLGAGALTVAVVTVGIGLVA